MICEAIRDAPALHYGMLGHDNTPLGQLQYLGLERTGLTERAIISLAEYLGSRFCGLRELRLGNERLNEDGWDRLVKAIRYNTSLEALTLRSLTGFGTD